MITCGILPPREDICLHEDLKHCPCLRPDKHLGPHLFLVPRSGHVLWDTDWDCDCENCLSGDSNDWCVVYSDVTPEEAESYIRDPERE